MIRQARAEDMSAIQELAHLRGVRPVPEKLLQDVFLIEESQGVLHGFVWAMVSHGFETAYVDYWTVHPKFKGAGPRLGIKLLRILSRLGVQEIFGVVSLRQDGSAYESYQILNRAGLQLLSNPFSFFRGTVEELTARWAAKALTNKQLN